MYRHDSPYASEKSFDLGERLPLVPRHQPLPVVPEGNESHGNFRDPAFHQDISRSLTLWNQCILDSEEFSLLVNVV